MIKSLPRPSLPPVQILFRPMLFAALGLHALLLFIPFPQEQKKPPEEKEAPVKITQLPTTKSGVQTKITPKVTVPKATSPSLPKINRPSTSPTVLKASPNLPQLTSATETPVPPGAKGTASSNNENVANPFQDFPHFQPSTTNCFDKGLGENCRIASANLAAVAAFYQSEPGKKKFDVKPIEQSATTKIFEVTKAGKTYYLSLFEDGTTTVVLLSETKVADLATLKGSVVPPEEYITLLGNVIPDGDRDSAIGNVATAEQFEQPQFFYSTVATEQEAQNGVQSVLRAGVDNAKFALGQAPADFYASFLQADLQSNLSSVKKLEPYGGGDLYELKKGSTTIYMSLVPMKGEVGTIVVTWLKDPRS
jgi:hypothetical protein